MATMMTGSHQHTAGATRPTGKGGCGCGCSDQPPVECCDLECLVRPNFFCGQLLTDADLTALVTWTRTRLSLSRYRDGWGVVCGLNVYCGPAEHAHHGSGQTGQHSGMITVTPGYAVDCCGRDLVLCRPASVDLGDVCQPEVDPCCDPPAKTPDPKQKKPPAAADPCSPFQKREDLIALDLYLVYDEQPQENQRVLLQGKCGDRAACQPTRIAETPRLEYRKVDLAARARETEEEKHIRQVKEDLARLHKELSGMEDPATMLRFIQQPGHRPHTFCFLEEYLCCLMREHPDPLPQDWQATTIRLILIDFLIYRTTCDCRPCLSHSGVRLARILVGQKTGRCGPECQVLMISQSSPEDRRPIQRDECYPVDPKLISFRRVAGMQSDKAQDELRAMRMEYRVKPLGTDPGSVEAMIAKFTLTARPGANTVLHTLEIPFLGERIVGLTEQ